MDYLRGVSGDFVLRMAYGVMILVTGVDVHNVVTSAIAEVIVASLYNIRFS